MNNHHVYDMLVVGGGSGGYTAALYAARAGLDTIVLEKLSAGGQMALTEQIDNYPGFEDGIDGFSLAEKMQKQAERFGARSEYAEVLRMDLTAVPKLVETSEGIFLGKTVVLATGADPRTLGVARESELVGRGVALLRRLRRDVLQGQNGGRGGRRQFRRGRRPPSQPRGEKVILVHRRDTLRATKIYHEPLAQAENVEFRWNSVVSALLSGDRLTGVRLRDTVTGEESVVDCDGVFVSVGRQPATALAVGQLALDGGGYIVAGETTETSIPGVYAVGDDADEAPPSGGHRRGGRRGGSPHGGEIYRGKPIREVDSKSHV
ncbi:MAG: NAD(P)/FAD-dependent oxidoreductase [Oscillospiraceae bacterium]